MSAARREQILAWLDDRATGGHPDQCNPDERFRMAADQIRIQAARIAELEAAQAAAPDIAKVSAKPEWRRIIDLFTSNGLPEPPWRLRDELVVHLAAYEEMPRLRAELERARAAALDEAAAIATGWLDAFVQEPIEFIDASTFAADAVRDIRDAITALKRASEAVIKRELITEAGIEAAAKDAAWPWSALREVWREFAEAEICGFPLSGGDALAILGRHGLCTTKEANDALAIERAILQAGGG